MTLRVPKQGLAPFRLLYTLLFVEYFVEFLGLARVLTRFLVGGFFLCQGLNGFFNFFTIPEPKAELSQFLDIFFKVKGLLLSIKLGQVFIGLALILGQALGPAILLLGVMVWGICLLQWQLNQGRRLAIGLSSAYLLLVLLHLRELMLLFFL